MPRSRTLRPIPLRTQRRPYHGIRRQVPFLNFLYSGGFSLIRTSFVLRLLKSFPVPL